MELKRGKRETDDGRERERRTIETDLGLCTVKLCEVVEVEEDVKALKLGAVRRFRVIGIVYDEG